MGFVRLGIGSKNRRLMVLITVLVCRQVSDEFFGRKPLCYTKYLTRRDMYAPCR